MTEIQSNLEVPVSETDSVIKVMHVITDLDVGGAESMLSSYLMTHRTMAPKVVVVSLLPGGYFHDRLRNAGVRVFDLNMRRDTPSVASVFRLAKLIARERPDVVQGWMYHADLLTTLALLLSGRLRKTRFYWGVRCSDMDTSKYGFALRFAIWCCSWLSWIPDAVIANSYAGRKVHRELGYKTKHFPVISNGVDTKRFKPDEDARKRIRNQFEIPDDRLVLTMIARVDPMKDHKTFLSALDKLPEVTAILVGKGTETIATRPNLHCLGVLNNVEEVYAASDVVLLCSAFGEGFPNVLVEGMACGLIPVATDVGDCARIMGELGHCVRVGNAAALTGAVQNIMDAGQEAVRAEREKSRQRIIDCFSLGESAKEFDNLYNGTKQIFEDVETEKTRQPVLALTSALVSRLSIFATLIAAAHLLNPMDFGVFVVLMAIVGVVNAFVSGGGDMWLNSFTASVSGKTERAPRVSHYYIGICSAIAGLTLIFLIIAVLANRVAGIGLGPLNGYHWSIIVAVCGAVAAGLFEAQLAVLRAGSQIATFFWLRDLITPLVVLALILLFHPSSPSGIIGVYSVVWLCVLIGVSSYLMLGREILPRLIGIGGVKSKRWLKLIKHTAGLVYGNIGSRLSIYIDVLVLTYVVNLSQVGEYRAAAQFAVGFMVVQHFVFLGLPWQMRRATLAGKPGPGYAWVLYQQRLLLLLSAFAVVVLWLFAEPILTLLGSRFADVVPLFHLFLLIRFVDLLWGPNHELLVSNGWTVNDAHANMLALVGWVLTFIVATIADLPPLTAAVVATAVASLTAQSSRYVMLRRVELVSIMGHPFGPLLPVIGSCVIIFMAIIMTQQNW